MSGFIYFFSATFAHLLSCVALLTQLVQKSSGGIIFSDQLSAEGW